jgi:hypothetical protein
MLAMACRGCPRYRAQPSRYVLQLMRWRTLRKGGFPFQSDDLSLQVWNDLGILEQVMESRMPRMF